MEKAKQATSNFLKRAGHHDTTVDEQVNPAVQHETINTTNREEVQTAVDKEVHQDHYHTTVQPVQDREVLPEQHSHRLAQTQQREFEHGDNDALKQRLAQEQSQFRDERTIGHTTDTRAEAATVGGEHVHHHVHENIQPVVDKETIQPNVIHTTIPVHEQHHNAPTHHNASALPAVSMEQFKQQGGSLSGRETRHDEFEGTPKYSSASTGAAVGGAGMMNKTRRPHRTGRTRRDSSSSSSSDDETKNASKKSARRDRMATGSQKPSMMDKMNPKTDADQDGKGGFMK